ncbi:MAG: aminoacyl-tRNA hydrolase [Acidobacteria bacterium]|nr:aminoacyl-tRNA hydrolase [Acidobacteriota bacterium]
MKLIVGLGNPGFEYQLTPHNLGFLAVDRLAESCGVEIARREAQSLTASSEIERVDVVLAKPQTYMNLSGMAVARLLDCYELGPRDLMILVDDADLPFGMLRIRQRGSAGSHNGLKSVIGALQSDEFVRVRMGVEPVEPVEDLASHVLGRFHKSDLETVAEILDQAAEAVRVILKEGISRAMNRFNRRVASPPS